MKNEIIIFKDEDIRLEVSMHDETVWLTQAQIAELFATQRPAITKHIGNIFKSEELFKDEVCSKMEHTASDEKKYNTGFYNLDVIIAVGYRVNSKRATSFRRCFYKIVKMK